MYAILDTREYVSVHTLKLCCMVFAIKKKEQQ
jgi:hypothetical protein